MLASSGPRLRISNRSVLLAVALAGAAVVAVRLFTASTRVLGWLAVATILAGLFHPLVARLGQRLPRGAAVAVVVVGAIAVVGTIGYASVDAVRRQADGLERAAPAAAEAIEESDGVGETAREFELRMKVDDFVKGLPERLRGGTPAQALRSNATRGVAYLATGVLFLFLLGHGPALVAGAMAQVHDDRRRARLAMVLGAAYRRSVRYVGFTVLRMGAAGLFTWAVCHILGLPAATLLGLTVAMTSIVPLFGVLLGLVPVLLLVIAFMPGRTAIVLGVFVAWQLAEVFVVQRRLERRSLHVGPVLSLVAAMVGLELYGFGGAVVALVLTVFVASVASEVVSGRGEWLAETSSG